MQLSDYAGRKEVSVEDTRLAAEMATQRGEVRRRPMPSLLREMAAACNRKNLPDQRRQKMLPPKRDTFVDNGKLRNWQVVVPHRISEQRRALTAYVPALRGRPGKEQGLARAGGSAAPKIQIRLGAAPPAAEERVDLNDMLALVADQQQGVDYDDDADMWDAEQPK
jgi:hypothetical protein